jgi:hypothetical protein
VKQGNVVVPTEGALTFMTHLIDYAGLFPPASLPLKAAIHNYADYKTSLDAWMLGRFIIPIARLEELNEYVSLFTPELPLFCVGLGSKRNELRECLAGLKDDLAKMAAFCDRYGDLVRFDVLELPLPQTLVDRELLKAIGDMTAEHGLNTFCEMTVALDSSWERALEATLDVIAEHNAANGSVLGFKLRTGGVSAAAFPTPGQVAMALIGCRDRKIPMKFTAGLHHPIRMHRNEVGVRMHGFVNVFVAGMLAHRHHLTVLETEQILTDEDSTHFSFTAEGVAWKDKMIAVSAVDQLRTTLLRSYGSCSFDEPRADLRSLQIL